MKTYLFCLLFLGCSTYVPVGYRTPSEYPAIRESYVAISIPKESKLSPTFKNDLIKELGEAINTDGWLRYKKEKGPKQLYEILITQFDTSSEAIPAVTETVDKRTYRTSSYRAVGAAEFSIKKIGDEAPVTKFDLSTNTIVASKVEMPDILGAFGRVSVFSTLMGNNSEADIAEKQDSALSIEAVLEARSRLINDIRLKFTPNLNIVKIKLEDDSKDMDDLKTLIKDQDLTGAVIYLDYLNAKDKRSDVFYNLGVVYEALGYFQEACGLYKSAYDINAKDFYLKEKEACEARLKNYFLLPQ